MHACDIIGGTLIWLPVTGLAVVAHSQSHSAELQWQHLQSQYRELDLLQTTKEAGHRSPLRRLLAKKAAAAADDEDEEGADDSYEDEIDLDEPMAAGRPFLLSASCFLLFSTRRAGLFVVDAVWGLVTLSLLAMSHRRCSTSEMRRP